MAAVTTADVGSWWKMQLPDWWVAAAVASPASLAVIEDLHRRAFARLQACADKKHLSLWRLDSDAMMAATRRERLSLYWEETECLTYYGMLSLHEIFEVVGSQLTETDVEVLSFLLDESYSGRHPLDPAGWTPDTYDENPAGAGEASGSDTTTSPRLLEAWRRIGPSGSPSCPVAARYRPKSGVELLLELERRGHVSEGRLEPLLQLLRVLTRHDLLPFVSRKKRRTVSPERPNVEYFEDRREVSAVGISDSSGQTNSPQDCLQQPWRAGVTPSRKKAPSARRKRGRGCRHARTRTVEMTEPSVQSPVSSQPQPVPEKITCG
uniref:Death effector domain-containing 1 n=1 Tax=Scleropages formosus TaxID=113540 RepID=A0A8C9RV81_SCLFO